MMTIVTLCMDSCLHFDSAQWPQGNDRTLKETHNRRVNEKLVFQTPNNNNNGKIPIHAISYFIKLSNLSK